MVAKVPRCLICKSPAMRLYVDGLLEKGISNAGIASGVMDMGGSLDPDVVARHRKGHWVKPERTEGPRPTKRDLATLVAEKTYDLVEDASPEAMLVFAKDFAPIIGKGLQAQTILDKREVNDKRLGLAAGALTLQAFIAGMGTGAPPPELDDGMTIDGTATAIE